MTLPRRKVLAWVIAALAIAGAGTFLWNAASFSIECDFVEEGKVSNVLGLDFDISTTDCWHDPITSIRVRAVDAAEAVIVFQYRAWWGPRVTIAAVDDQTVKISLPAIGSIVCQKETLGAVTFKYDIGQVEYPHEPGQCVPVVDEPRRS